MSLYQNLVKKCKIQENSRIVVSDEKLKKFVELICNPSENNFVQMGYKSGLFDGTGEVDFDSVKNFYEQISKEITKYKNENNSLLGIEEHLGIVEKKVNKLKM